MSQNISELDAGALPNQGGNGMGSHGSNEGRGGIGSRLVGFVDDHINPIVVKELRQAVRSRFIMVVINLLLMIELVIVAGFLLGSTGSDYSLGRNVFTALHLLLLTTAVIFVPAYVGVRFAAERSAQNVDLMFTTTISPLSIIWGKFLSGLIVSALLFSTAGPFMVLTYMLRGIDVPSILLILGMDFLAVLAAIQFAILVMSGSKTVVARGGMLVLCMIVFGYLIVGAGAASMGLMFGYGSGWWNEPYAWLYIVGYLLLNLIYHIGMMLASAAVVSPPTSNRAVGLRTFLFVSWILSGVLCLLTSAFTMDTEWALAWGMSSASISCVILLVAISERDRWGPRVLMMIPRNPIKRFIAFFFYSGSAGGVLLSMFMILVSLGITLFMFDDYHDEVMAMLTFCLYFAAYCLSSVFIVRYLTGGLVKTEATAAITLLLLALGCMGPALIAFFIDPMGRWDRGVLWRIGNPFGGMMGNSNDEDTFLIIGLLWALTMFVMCAPWMLGQLREFRRPPTKPVTAEEEFDRMLVEHDQAPPLLEDPQVKADI